MADLRTSTCEYGSYSHAILLYSVADPLQTPLLNIQVDRSLVLSKGKEVTGKLLIELQVRKSTADATGSREFYNNLTKPIQGWEGKIRDIVLRKKLVRYIHLSSHFVGMIVINYSSFFFFSPAKYSSSQIRV
jgi:Peptidase family M49